MDSFERYLREMGCGPKPGEYPNHWALAELERVVGAEALASSPGPKNRPEWDVMAQFSKRNLRRLRGARYMRSGGMQPDQLAEVIVPRVAEVETCDESTEWYVKTALVAIKERRRERHFQRHLRVAQSTGHSTYYEHRTEYARSLGYRSVWEMRKARGWT